MITIFSGRTSKYKKKMHKIDYYTFYEYEMVIYSGGHLGISHIKIHNVIISRPNPQLLLHERYTFFFYWRYLIVQIFLVLQIFYK